MGLREDMETAFKELSSDEEKNEVPQQEVVAENDEFQTRESELQKSLEDSSKVAEKPPRSRDVSGKFSPKTPALEPGKEKPEPKEEKTAVAGEIEVSSAQKVRAPTSWSPEEREAWDNIDPRAKSAILRRDAEVNAVLRNTAEARQFTGEFQKIIGPYMPMIQAENSTPLRAVQYLLDTSAKLRTAPAPQKAELVADMILQFGIDIETLDKVLTTRVQSGGARQQNSQILDTVRQEIKPVVDFVTSMQQNQHSSAEQEAARIWQEFADNPENEYAYDVKDDMAALLIAYANMNRPLSLQDAYKLATMQHPKISGLLKSRAERDLAQQNQAARRAREASASLASSGAPMSTENESSDGSLRGDVLSTIRQLSEARR